MDLSLSLSMVRGGSRGATVYAGATPPAVDYDGTNDWATRGAGSMTGLNDGKQGTVSIWFRIDGGDGTPISFFNNDNGRALVRRSTSGFIQALCRNTANTTVLSIATVATYTTAATWRHVLISWDMATAGARHIYVDDVSNLAVTTFTDDTIDYDDNDFIVGAENTAGTNRWNGCLSEVFFHTSYLDITVEANRRKFRTSGGKPASLGADGSTPLGVQPLLYAPSGNPGTNLGSGGNFTVTGTLDAASTSPFS